MPFVDTFNGANNETPLEDLLSTGGGAWTLGGGQAGSVRILSTGGIRSANNPTNQYSYYFCEDQGSPHLYVIFRYFKSPNYNSAVCVKLLDQYNYIGLLNYSASWIYIVRVNNGSFNYTDYKEAVDGEWIKLSVTNNVLSWFTGGTGSSPGAWSLINTNISLTTLQTVTRSGLLSYSTNTSTWLDYFEAGPLPGPLTVNALTQAQTHGTLTLTQRNIITPSNLLNNQALENGQLNAIQLSNLSQPQFIGTSQFTLGASIRATNMRQAQSITASAVIPIAFITSDLNQSMSLQTVSFINKYLISPASVSQSMTIGTSLLKFFQYVFGNSKPSQIMRWRCYVDGVEIRLTSIQLRKYSDRGWNLNVVTPDVIAINLNAVCVVEADLYYADGSFYTETLAETFVTNTSITKGSTSLSVSITGSNVTPNIVNKTREISNVTNVLTIDGKRYLRTPIDIDMNAGDHLLYDNGVLIVDRITYFISTNQASMEIIE